MRRRIQAPSSGRYSTRLPDEFFTGDEEHEADKPPRSLFSVGDYKQSIYSFQGARPDLFTAQENHFRRLAENAHKPFSRVDLDTSFRSVVPVLGVVDQVTQSQLDNGQPALPGLHETSAGDVAGHVVLRLGQAGFVDMMDVVVDTELAEDAPAMALMSNRCWPARLLRPSVHGSARACCRRGAV